MNKNIFVSFHHKLNSDHAQYIRSVIKSLGYNDITLNEGNKIENEDFLTDEEIRKRIRDKFLRDSDVTIVIVGSDTKNRKHIDWELRSSMHKFDDGPHGAIVIINAIDFSELNGSDGSWILSNNLINAYGNAYGRNWQPKVDERILIGMPDRVSSSIKNNYSYQSSLSGNHKHAVFPIVHYNRIKHNNLILKYAIEQAIEYKNRNFGKWDTNSKMRRQNNESVHRTIFKQVPA